MIDDMGGISSRALRRTACVQTRFASLSNRRVLIRRPSPPLSERASARSDNGGEGGIRTREGRESLSVFKTDAFNRSATSPRGGRLAERHGKTNKILGH